MYHLTLYINSKYFRLHILKLILPMKTTKTVAAKLFMLLVHHQEHQRIVKYLETRKSIGCINISQSPGRHTYSSTTFCRPTLSTALHFWYFILFTFKVAKLFNYIFIFIYLYVIIIIITLNCYQSSASVLRKIQILMWSYIIIGFLNDIMI